MKMERRRLRGGDKSPKKELFWGTLFHLLCRHREPLSQPVDQDYWLLWKFLRCVRELCGVQANTHRCSLAEAPRPWTLPAEALTAAMARFKHPSPTVITLIMKTERSGIHKQTLRCCGEWRTPKSGFKNVFCMSSVRHLNELVYVYWMF